MERWNVDWLFAQLVLLHDLAVLGLPPIMLLLVEMPVFTHTCVCLCFAMVMSSSSHVMLFFFSFLISNVNLDVKRLLVVGKDTGDVTCTSE